MLKGLKGILEKGLQIAAPIIGNMILPGAGGAMLGSGIASLLSGKKPKDALIAAGIAGLGAGKFFGPQGAKTSLIDKGAKQFTSERTPFFGKDGIMQNVMQSQFFTPRADSQGNITGPSIGGQILSAGIPAVLSYLAAEQDRKRSNVPDASEYMSAVDTAYGGQLAPPPEDRRVRNLFPVGAAQGGMMQEEPNGLAKLGNQISYSATTGGVMGMADGGDVDNFPRRTGEIRGPGTKTSDSIPAMLSDGEFVQRADAVNGAGVMMGAKNAQEAREKGSDFMYALQSKLAKMGKKVG